MTVKKWGVPEGRSKFGRLCEAVFDPVCRRTLLSSARQQAGRNTRVCDKNLSVRDFCQV